MMQRTALFSRPVPIVFFIVIAVLLDQAIKVAVEAWLPYGEDVALLPFLALHRIYNYGVAFSLFSGIERWAIIGLRVVVVAFVLYLWRKTPPDRTFAHLGYAMIIAGAIGNLIDGLLFGYVIDYVLFHLPVWNWSFAVFNLADSFITLGAMSIILDELLHMKKRDR
ncbi:signal peptidase II [Pararhizobium antarcticum]|uniref:Lipoprotein signal peptidase n=1 Tax=Pararhizobium antarcticum TaxID=1798805 RepID=A0A657LLP1_9HYPH|nr:signal peptidase II [Pararhizobium antarcticum]OJF90517.1 lipoprotein signal peptidase [Pararhizobium antarcticum]OJF98593.1 lipoprotein signal peptidase [Rhizobium sp. 58]